MSICTRVMEHPWYLAAQTVMAYAAMSEEPDLSPVLANILASGRRLVLPRCETRTVMTGRQVFGPDDLSPGMFGILEPNCSLPKVNPSEIDLVLVPGVGFDPRGRRLGRGNGYYDRFLHGFLGRTIGICFSDRLIQTIPTEDHDRSVDAVITDTKSIYCTGGEVPGCVLESE